MQARPDSALRRLHLMLDAATIVAAMVIAAWLQSALLNVLPFRSPAKFHDYASLVYLTLPLWLALIALLRLHCSFELVWTRGELLSRLILLHVFGLLGLTAIAFLTNSVINRSLVALFLLCTFSAMYAERLVFNAWARYQHRRGHGRERILLVGHPSRRMSEFVRDAARHSLPPEIVGYLRPPQTSDGLSTPPPGIELSCVGPLAELGRVLHESAIDQVMFFPPSNRPEELRDALAQCEEQGVVASFSVSLQQVARATPRVSSVFDHPFISFDVAPKRPELLALKYGLDPLLAAILIVVLAPLLLAVAIGSLFAMGRPVLFAQPRAGLRGRSFRMLKFRSMVVDAEHKQAALRAGNEMDGPVFKIENDPRITRFGRFLRRSSIDELPQLFNVLSGSMSLVGPRPLPLSEQEQIRGFQRRRLSMKPGITGLWQVRGRSALDFDEWMLLDLKYIDEWSLYLDLVILLQTLPAVLFGRGAR